MCDNRTYRETGSLDPIYMGLCACVHRVTYHRFNIFFMAAMDILAVLVNCVRDIGANLPCLIVMTNKPQCTKVCMQCLQDERATIMKNN